MPLQCYAAILHLFMMHDFLCLMRGFGILMVELESTLLHLFTSFAIGSHGGTITCANYYYSMRGVGKIVLTVANGGAFTLSDALWVLGIKKNLLSVSAIVFWLHGKILGW